MPEESLSDPKRRFSNRVEHYARCRPGYPRAVLDILREQTGLKDSAVIADIGSGTGLSTELFLANGNTVYAIEPNLEMREAADSRLRHNPRFHSVAGAAETTGLPDESLDYVIAAQAFHWFDKERAKREFARILRPNGWVVLMWNSRRIDATAFLQAYESMLQKYGTDYRQVDHTNITADVFERFYSPHPYTKRVVPNEQWFDLEGLRGRVLSSSCTPARGHPNYEPMMHALDEIFNAHQEHGQVTFLYDTEVYFGHVG